MDASGRTHVPVAVPHHPAGWTGNEFDASGLDCGLVIEELNEFTVGLPAFCLCWADYPGPASPN